MSDSGVYQTPPAPKSLDSSFLSDDLSLFHHHQQQQRDPDQMSVSSTTSSTGGPSPRDRRCEVGSASIYMPMAPGHGHSHSHSHSPGSSSKVSVSFDHVCIQHCSARALTVCINFILETGWPNLVSRLLSGRP